MSDLITLLFGLMCLSSLVTLVICAVWRNLEMTARDGTDRFNVRYGKSDKDKH